MSEVANSVGVTSVVFAVLMDVVVGVVIVVVGVVMVDVGVDEFNVCDVCVVDLRVEVVEVAFVVVDGVV